MKIFVDVKANCDEQKVEVFEEGKRYRVFLKAVPRENEANLELLKLMKRFFKKKVVFVSGLKSKRKVLEVCDG